MAIFQVQALAVNESGTGRRDVDLKMGMLPRIRCIL
jgi:hypothetical protein